MENAYEKKKNDIQGEINFVYKENERLLDMSFEF